MARILVGGLGVLLLFIGGLFLWQGRAGQEEAIPAAPPPEPALSADALPSADVSGLRGPEPPVATEQSREEVRFGKYDRNRDKIISRVEMMSSRTRDFRKLDTDGNNLLTFEEWAVATSNRFAGADADRNGELTPQEFLVTKPKPVVKPKCRC